MEKKDLVQLLEAERSRMLAYAYGILRQHQDAEDVVQNAMIIALQKPELLTADNAIGWLLKATRFEALNTYRKTKKLKVGLDPKVLELLESSALDQEPQPNGHDLGPCLEKVSERNRNILRWRYEDGLKGEALAQKCGVSLAALYKALNRTQQALKSCLERRTL